MAYSGISRPVSLDNLSEVAADLANVSKQASDVIDDYSLYDSIMSGLTGVTDVVQTDLGRNVFQGANIAPEIFGSRTQGLSELLIGQGAGRSAYGLFGDAK